MNYQEGQGDHDLQNRQVCLLEVKDKSLF